MMLSMIDFPTPDYETKKDKKKKAKKGFGTPISELDKETQNQIRK
jgi:fructose-1,6-bisphosphatase/inositol monophosphatase family enzyme